MANAGARSGVMNRARSDLRVLAKLLVVVTLLALPTAVVLKGYAAHDGFLRLIYFGQKFADTSLPEVRAIDPPRLTEWGYDGQFYAQVALVPLLDRPELSRAVDDPTYRARRIGLPLLAFAFGLGRPWLVLQSYAVLNLFFAFVLAAALYRYSSLHNGRDFLLAGALLWSTGALASLARALPDFPAVVLGVVGTISNLPAVAAALCFACGGLFKETSALTFIACAWPDYRDDKARFKRWLIISAVMSVPLALWFVYMYAMLSGGMGWETENFSRPFAGIARKLHDASANLVFTTGGGRKERLFEFICPLSLLVQAAYLFFRPRLDSELWRFGIGFAVLLFFLGASIWVEQYSSPRVLLPLTFSFNLLLHKHERGSLYAAWYVAGNLGMAWLCLRALPFFR